MVGGTIAILVPPIFKMAESSRARSQPSFSHPQVTNDEGTINKDPFENSPDKQISEDTRDVEKTLTCAICQSTYYDPRILPCLHSFCKACLLNLIGTREVCGHKLKCPLCRSEHILTANGVDDLTPHTQLASEVENLLAEGPEKQCGECEGTNVISFCSDCENFLCDFCDQAHKKMASFKSHVLVQVPKAAKTIPKTKFKCHKHPTESLEVYCIQCKSVICRDCLYYTHNGHKFKRLVDVSDEIQRSLVSDSAQLAVKLRTFRSHAKAIAEVEKHVTTYPDEMKAFIANQFEEFHKMLEKRKETLLKEVDTQYNGFSKTLWVEKDIVETSICKLEAGIKFAQQVAKSEDKFEVAVLGNKALASMSTMAKTVLWNPSAIQNLGPLLYVPQQRGEFCPRIVGFLECGHSIKIDVTKEGYDFFHDDGDFLDFPSQSEQEYYPPGSTPFQPSGYFQLGVEVQKPFFPEIRVSFDCKMTTSAEKVWYTSTLQNGKWIVRFQTAYPESYVITITVQLNGRDICIKEETITVASPSQYLCSWDI